MHLDPSRNSGYTIWDPVPNAIYKISVLEKQGVNYLTLSSHNSIKNYTRFDPLIFTIPNIYYQIDVLNSAGTIISTTDPLRPNSYNGSGSVNGNSIVCNGTSYSWSLTENYSVLSIDQLTGLPSALGNRQLIAGGAVVSVDPISGFVTPFWQPISTYQWGLLPNNHPYKELYDRVPIILNDGTGPWVDKNNSPVDQGWLVAKSMDEYQKFDWLNTAPSASAPAILSNSSTSLLSFYEDFYNDYHLPASPLGSFFFSEVSELECTEAYGTAEGGSEGDEGEEGGFNEWWNDLVQDFAKEVGEGITDNVHSNGGLNLVSWEDFYQVLNPLGGIVSANGDCIKLIRINSILDDNIIASFTLDEPFGRFTLKNITGHLTPGLYKMTIFTSKSQLVIPSVIEINSEIPIPQDKDFFDLSIAPNPVENNLLNYSISGSRPTNATLLVYNLNGDILSVQTRLIGGTPIRIHEVLDVTSMAKPYNQVSIALIFPDGSIIQKTAMTL